jgi:hypothetical protein
LYHFAGGGSFRLPNRLGYERQNMKTFGAAFLYVFAQGLIALLWHYVWNDDEDEPFWKTLFYICLTSLALAGLKIWLD